MSYVRLSDVMSACTRFCQVRQLSSGYFNFRSSYVKLCQVGQVLSLFFKVNSGNYKFYQVGSRLVQIS
jgi:hypothetical protein